jgi:hypothetical protein
MFLKRCLRLTLIPLLAVVIWSFHEAEASGVRGTVRPVEAVESIWLVTGKDTARAVPVNGIFSITANPGVYQLIVAATPGYKDMLLERIMVEDGRMTDVGELLIQKLNP